MVEGKFLTFMLNGYLYAFSIDCIKEILNDWGGISPVPEFPEYGRGIINVRGDIIPVVDMRRRLSMPPAGSAVKNCIVVTEDSSTSLGSIGFMVDSVNTVMDFEQANMSDAPRLSAVSCKYLNGVYKHGTDIIMILEPSRLLTDDMIGAIDSYAEQRGLRK